MYLFNIVYQEKHSTIVDYFDIKSSGARTKLVNICTAIGLYGPFKMLSYKGEHVTLWYGLLNGSENVLPISLTIECSFPFKVSNLKDMVEQIAGKQSQMEGTVVILTDQLKNLRAFETKLNDIQQQQQELAKQQEACQRTVKAHDKDLSNLKTRFDDLTSTSDPIPTDEGKTNQVFLLFFSYVHPTMCRLNQYLNHRVMQNTQNLNV